MPNLSNLTDPLPHSQIYFHTPSPTARETFLYPNCLGHFYCDRNYHISRSSYDSYLLMLIVKGNGIVSTPHIPGLETTFEQGQIVLIDCYEPHMYRATGNLEFYWVHFDGISAKAYYHYLVGLYGHIISPSQEQFAAVLQNMELLLQGFSSNRGLSELLLGKYLTDILSFPAHLENRFYKNPQLPGLLPPKHQATEAAVSYMRQHLCDDITTEKLAEHLSLSPYYFIKLFKKEYGVPPHQYLLSLRLESACFYLRSTEKTIKDIAFSCGFKSENNFCIAFKRHTGETPTEYRNK